MPATCVFLPWLRRGLGVHIGAGGAAPDGGRATIRVAVDVEHTLEQPNAPAQVVTRTATVTLPMFGPEDVTGLDPRCVQRVWPQPDVGDAEQNFLPLIEFSEPDLPWRYSPSAPSTDNRLRPWLCLLVLAEGEFELLPSGQERPLPVVRILGDAPLPDLSEAWAWAHGEVSETTTAADLEGILARTPARVVARLLAPRKLLARTRYTAVVVPTFERARKAGLRQPAGDAGGMDPAWSATTARPHELPVYYHWRFGTSSEGDFETLARRLVMRFSLPPGVGRRPVDLRGASPRLRATVDARPVETAELEGALTLLRAVPPPPPPPVELEVEPADPSASSLSALLDDLVASNRSSDLRPKVGPPAYGLWYSIQGPLPPRLRDPPRPWFASLNLDVRNRIPAGVGTQVIQDHQQALMVGAWAQLENIRRINEALRFAQLSREASSRIYHRDIIPMSTEALLRFTAPVHAHVMAGEVTVRAALARSPIDVGVLDPQWRRLSRSRGPLGRRQGRLSREKLPLLARLNRGQLAPSRPPVRSTTLATALYALKVAQIDGERLQRIRSAGEGSSVLGQLLVSARTSSPPPGAPPQEGWRRLRDKADAGVSPRTPDEIVDVIRGGPRRPDFKLWKDTGEGREDDPARLRDATFGERDSTAAERFRSALVRLAESLGGPPLPRRGAAPADLDALASTVREALDPTRTMADAMSARLHLASSRAWQNPDDPLEPVMAYPEFPQPMYEPLRELSQEWLLPGLEHVPANSIALFQTNRPFIEAYMVGLNHELGSRDERRGTSPKSKMRAAASGVSSGRY